MIVINELRYLIWHIVWSMDDQGRTSTVEWREHHYPYDDNSHAVIETVTTSDRPLSGAAHDAFNRMCWQALQHGSRSAMLSHVRRLGVEI